MYLVLTTPQAISVEDKLTEVPSLQRGVEVTPYHGQLLSNIRRPFVRPACTVAQVPSWREDENHYALVVTNKISLKKSKDREVS